MKTVIVFGATGGVGAYLVLDLVAAGYDVVAVGRRKSDNGYFKSIGVEYISVDISENFNINELPTTVFAVIHLAGAMPAKMEGYNPKEYVDSIMNGTLNVLNYAVNANADRVVFSHSVSDISYAYGTTQRLDEGIPGKFTANDDHSVYSICKMAAVNLVEHYYHRHGLKRFIIRIPNVYVYHPNPYYYVDGKQQWQNYRLLISRAREGKIIEIWGNPNKVRDMLYVKDMTQMIVCSLNAKHGGGLYNAGTGTGVSLEDQIRGIIEVFDERKQCQVVYRPYYPDAVQYIMDIGKAKKELGYTPEYDYMRYLKDFKKEMGLNRFKDIHK